MILLKLFSFTEFILTILEIGAIIAACGLLLTIILVIFFLKHLKKRNGTKNNRSECLIPMGPTNELLALRNTIGTMIKGNTEFSPKKQFEELEINDERRADHFPCTMALKYSSKIKARCLNANPDVIPYDSTRVVLRKKIKGTNYINATWLNKAEKEGEYSVPTLNPYIPFSKLNIITTQNPMKQTEQHYYQMLYENYITVVICFCSRNEFKSSEFYSEFDEQINVFKVKMLKGKVIAPFLAVRNVEVYHSGDKDTQKFRMFQFIDWPDFGMCGKTDEYRGKFLSAISLMRKMIGKDNTTTNMIVQDAIGGVGGAAVFVILLKLLQAVDESIDNATPDGELSDYQMTILNVFETVNCMRKKRAKLVSSFAEYLFMIECLLDYVNEKQYFNKLTIENFHDSKVVEDSIYFTTIK